VGRTTLDGHQARAEESTMSIRRIVITTAMTAVMAFATTSLAEMADRSSGALEVKKQGEISYVSGGAGDEEQKALEQASRDFNLKVTFASPTGQYGGGNRLEIRDQAGNTVLDTSARGPLFYADLPPGKYTIAAMNGAGAPQKKTVQLAADGRSEVLFSIEQAERDPGTMDPRSARGADME
jgi:hypothetical protein